MLGPLHLSMEHLSALFVPIYNQRERRNEVNKRLKVEVNNHTI